MSNKIETVYVAGVLTPKGYFAKHPAIDYLTAIGELVNHSLDVFFAGFDPFCPALDYLFFVVKGKGRTITEAMIKRYSKAWLRRCDAMVLTPGWQTSSGTIAELKVCLEENIIVFEHIEDLKEHRPVTVSTVTKWVEKYS